MNKKLVLALMGMTTAAGIAGAANVDVTANITNSVTWTSNDVYNLVGQIYVEDGATLTIDAGTLIQSESGAGGSLAVSRGGKIYVNGTADHPVIMTSTDDDLVSWHEGANEWGNLTLMVKPTFLRPATGLVHVRVMLPTRPHPMKSRWKDWSVDLKPTMAVVTIMTTVVRSAIYPFVTVVKWLARTMS